MSASVVTDAHIDVLLDIFKQYGGPRYGRHAHDGPMSWLDRSANPIRRRDFADHDRNETLLGRMLLQQNLRSVASRYQEDEGDASTYTYRPTYRKFQPSTELLAIAGFVYQACETDDWERTEAFGFCEALNQRVVEYAIPEQDGDQWAWSDGLLGRTTSKPQEAASFPNGTTLIAYDDDLHLGLFVRRDGEAEPFVVAGWVYGDDEWYGGHYFITLAAAQAYYNQRTSEAAS